MSSSSCAEASCQRRGVWYYVHVCDMVRKIEHLRTPQQTIIHLEVHIRGPIAYVFPLAPCRTRPSTDSKLERHRGFDAPQCIADLLGGGQGSASREATFPATGMRVQWSLSRRPSVAAAKETKPTCITTRFDRRGRARESQPLQDESDRLTAGKPEPAGMLASRHALVAARLFDCGDIKLAAQIAQWLLYVHMRVKPAFPAPAPAPIAHAYLIGRPSGRRLDRRS